MALAVAFVLTGCVGVKVVPSGTGSSTANNKSEKIQTPDTEEVVLNIVDWRDSTKKQREKLNEKFMEEHPNVTVNYTTLRRLSLMRQCCREFVRERLRICSLYRQRQPFLLLSTKAGFFQWTCIYKKIFLNSFSRKY